MSGVSRFPRVLQCDSLVTAIDGPERNCMFRHKQRYSERMTGTRLICMVFVQLTRPKSPQTDR